MDQVEAPSFDLPGGTYSADLAIGLDCATTGAIIRYEVASGSTPPDPTANSPRALPDTRLSCVGHDSTLTVKARAFKAGMYDSAVASATWTVVYNQTTPPVITPASGSYPSNVSVTITCADPDAVIYFTSSTSGLPDDPTPTSAVWDPALPLELAEDDASLGIKAIAVAPGKLPSAIDSAQITVNYETVSTPHFSPEAGTYTTPQTVTIECPTPGASIRYTLDGTMPSETAGTLYESAFAVSASATVQAIAYKIGLAASELASAAYVITGTVATPTISPAAGTYTSAQTVSLACATPGAFIRYTIDGTTPSETSGTLYSGSFSVSASATVRAIAYKADWVTSGLASAAYFITGTVATPTISPAAGTYSSAQTVSLASATPGATIRYTIDGTTPSETSGTLYSGSFSVSASATVRAIAYKTDWVTSELVHAAYVIMGTVAMPVFSPAAGTYTSAQNVSLTCATPGTTIHYTIDGSTPSETSGTFYTGAFTVSANATVRAIAYKAGDVTSALASAAYVITGTVATPTISPAAGTYTSAQTVSLTCATPGATIHYTTDGTTPSETVGTPYSGSFAVSANATVRAIAYKPDWVTSSLATAAYVITGTVATPTFSPAAGTYISSRFVTITSATPGASIRYTTNGTTPTETVGTLYSGGFTVSASATVRAIAYKTDWLTSGLASAAYVITGTVSSPTINPPGYTFTSAQTVSISCTTGGASIRYTLDGTTPSETVGIPYVGPFTVSATTMVYAIAYQAGWASSGVSGHSFTITGTVATPIITPTAGTYTSAQTVSLSCATPGSSIRYTTDGTTPSTTTGILYSDPITVSSSATVKAIAYQSGWTTSSVASAAYVITGTVATPLISPAAGTYTSTRIVNITCATPGSSIRYTTDGTTPSETDGTLYSGFFAVSTSTTVRAIAYKTSWAMSDLASAAIIITGTVATPVISPAAGTYTSAQTVSISCATPGATIHYTTDGTAPSETVGTEYAGAFPVAASCTVRAIAVQSGWISSSAVSTAYTITGKVAMPAFSTEPGTYDGARVVTITTTTPGAVIRYTLDGTTPTTSYGTVCAGSVTISSTATLKAVAYLATWETSDVASGTYVINGSIAIDPLDGSTLNIALSGMPTQLGRGLTKMVTATPSKPASLIEWYVDGVLRSSGSSDSYALGAGLSIGPHTLTVLARSGTVDYSVTADFTVIPLTQVTEFDFESGALLPQFNNTTTTWTVVASGAASSAYAIRSAAIGHSATTTARLTGTVPAGKTLATVTFAYRASSESNWDKLIFYVNGVAQNTGWSGTVGWTNVTYSLDLPAGSSYVLDWTYTKDGSGTAGSDAVWIDNIYLEIN